MLTERMRRVIPLLLALVAAIPQAAFAGQSYRCRYTGQTHATSCCPESGPARDVDARVSRAECCELLRTDPSTLDALGPRDGETVIPSLAIPAIAPQLDLGAPAPARSPIARATAPPEPRDPAYLLFSSLLL